MARSRSRFPRQAVTARRKSSWSSGPASTATGGVQTISASGVTPLGLGAGITADGVTLVRTRGELLLFLATASASTNGFYGAFGIGVVSDQAFAAGGASMPSPITNVDWEGWLYYRNLSIISGGIIDGTAASEDSLVNPVSASLRLEVDSKAMRKVGINETIFAVLDLVEIGTAALKVFFNSRMLFKLP